MFRALLVFRVGDVLTAFDLKRALKSDVGFSVPCSNSSTALKRHQGPAFQEDKAGSVCSGFASPSGGDGLFFPFQEGKAGSVLCHGRNSAELLLFFFVLSLHFLSRSISEVLL